MNSDGGKKQDLDIDKQKRTPSCMVDAISTLELLGRNEKFAR
jgi:hypothetical protein